MFHQGDTKATISIADELGKLAKLKEQGVIIDEEFSQMKRNNGRNERPLNKVYVFMARREILQLEYPDSSPSLKM